MQTLKYKNNLKRVKYFKSFKKMPLSLINL